MYPYRCSVCKGEKGESVFRSERGYYFCEEDRQNFCNLCKEPLSLEEKEVLPKHFCFTGDLHKLCLRCLKKELEKDKTRKIKKARYAFKAMNFQIKFQTCLKCCKLNDSRDAKGTVVSRFCRKCRKIHSIELGDRLFLERSGRIRRDYNVDQRTMVFDWVVGYRERK